MTENYNDTHKEYFSFEDYLKKALTSCQTVIQTYKNLSRDKDDMINSTKDLFASSIRNASKDSIKAAVHFSIDSVIHYDNLFDISSFIRENGELDFEAMDKDSHNEELNKKRKANYDAAAFPIKSKINEIIAGAKAFFTDTNFTKSVSALNIAFERNDISDIKLLTAITIASANSANAALLQADADWHNKYTGANVKTLSKYLDASNPNPIISDDIISGAAEAAYAVSVYINNASIVETTLTALSFSTAYGYACGADISDHTEEDCAYFHAAAITVMTKQLQACTYPFK